MFFEEARAILNHYCRLLAGQEASTNKVIKMHPNLNANERNWWLAKSETTPDFRNPRSVAYLTAYFAIAGRNNFEASGIRLDDGFIWPDRAVMRAMLLSSSVVLDDTLFRLSESGELLLVPMLRIVNNKIVVSPAMAPRH